MIREISELLSSGLDKQLKVTITGRFSICIINLTTFNYCSLCYDAHLACIGLYCFQYISHEFEYYLNDPMVFDNIVSKIHQLLFANLDYSVSENT